jgi:hypothetical protein
MWKTTRKMTGGSENRQLNTDKEEEEEEEEEIKKSRGRRMQ